MIPNIRSLSSAQELAACARLMAASPPWSTLYFTEQQCRENLSTPTLELYGAEVAKRLVGFVATRATGMEGEPLLEYICVDADYRGHGIGSSMLEFVEEIYPNADNLYLFVSDINPRAIALYERVGYKRVGELPNYNLFGQTEYLYRKFRRPRQERFRPTGQLRPADGSSSRIHQSASPMLLQTEANDKDVLDLASGYPRFRLPEALADLVVEGTRAAMDDSGPNDEAKARLRDSVGELLGITSDKTARVCSTFSGSIALERVFVAVREHARATGKVGVTAVFHEPSIDLSYLLLKEHADVLIKGVVQQADSPGSRTDRLIEELEAQSRRSPNRQLLVIVDTPSNPLGTVTGAEDLQRLAAACGRSEAVLVVDHCFLLAGVHVPTTLPSVFDLPSDLCNWIGIWDTGKSIDICGDKIGFVIPGNTTMAAAVDGALAVIQPATYGARRAIEVFSRLLAAPELRTYLANGASVCRNNLERLQDQIPQGWSLPTPAAGTYACLYAPDAEKGSDRLRAEWLAAGVAVAAGRTFFSDTFTFVGEMTPFLRVSLFRNPDYFRAALRHFPGVSSPIES